MTLAGSGGGRGERPRARDPGRFAINLRLAAASQCQSTVGAGSPGSWYLLCSVVCTLDPCRKISTRYTLYAAQQGSARENPQCHTRRTPDPARPVGFTVHVASAEARLRYPLTNRVVSAEARLRYPLMHLRERHHEIDTRHLQQRHGQKSEKQDQRPQFPSSRHKSHAFGLGYPSAAPACLAGPQACGAASAPAASACVPSRAAIRRHRRFHLSVHLRPHLALYACGYPGHDRPQSRHP